MCYHRKHVLKKIGGRQCWLAEPKKTSMRVHAPQCKLSNSPRHSVKPMRAKWTDYGIFTGSPRTSRTEQESKCSTDSMTRFGLQFAHRGEFNFCCP